MAFFANATAGILSGQEMIRGQVALRHTGLLGIPIVNVENACASASSAFSLACMAVGSGAVDVALAVGAEKLTHPDKAATFNAIGTAVDLFELDDLKRRLLPGEVDDGNTGKRSFFMDVYAAIAPVHGAQRRDHRGLRPGRGQEPPPRHAQPQGPVPTRSHDRAGALQPRDLRGR